jgi:hypothetical protein
MLEKVKGVVTKQRAFDVALLDSFASASLQELDYLNEADNQVPILRILNLKIIKYPAQPLLNLFYKLGRKCTLRYFVVTRNQELAPKIV